MDPRPPAVAETKEMPPFPADALAARNAVMEALTGSPGKVRETLKLVAKTRKRLRDTHEMAPWKEDAPQTPVDVAKRIVAQVARTAEMFRYVEERAFQGQVDGSALFRHTTPRAYTGPISAPGFINVFPAKAEVMMRFFQIFPGISSDDRLHPAEALEAAANAHNNLLAPNAITIAPSLEPVLAEVRAEMGDDFTGTLGAHLAGLESEIQAVMAGIGQVGADAILDEKIELRSEALITALEKLTRNMVAGFDKFGKEKLFPKKPDFAEIEMAKETAPYYKIKRALTGILSGARPEAESELDPAIEAIGIGPSSRATIHRFVIDLKAQYKSELQSGTAEELADYIIENLISLKIQALLHLRSQNQAAPSPQTIAHQFYILNCYFLQHLRNSLGAQLVCPLMVDDQAEGAPEGVTLRLMDYNDNPEVSEEAHKMKVVATLIGILNKCLRAMRISRYQRALLGTLQ